MDSTIPLTGPLTGQLTSLDLLVRDATQWLVDRGVALRSGIRLAEASSERRAQERELGRDLDLELGYGPGWERARTHTAAGGLLGCVQFQWESKHLYRLGVDLEAADRPVAGPVLERVLDADERGLGYGALEAWVIKEAAFKAMPSDLQAQTKVLSEISITHDEWGRRGCERVGVYRILRNNHWILAAAQYNTKLLKYKK